jgi:hypothetical protein
MNPNIIDSSPASAHFETYQIIREGLGYRVFENNWREKYCANFLAWTKSPLKFPLF